MVLQRDTQMGSALEALRQVLQTLPAGPERLRAEQAYRRIEQQVGPVPQRRGRVPQPNEVRAADSADPTTVSVTTTAPVPAVPKLELPADWDPLAEYTRAVQTQLIEAMLNFSHSLNLGPDEWLTVAAHDSHGPSMPGQIDDSSDDHPEGQGQRFGHLCRRSHPTRRDSQEGRGPRFLIYNRRA